MPLSSPAGYRKRDNFTGRVFGSSSAGLLIGKPDTAFTKGILTAPDNVVSLWKGPAYSGDADTGRNLEVHYATADAATTDYVAVQKIMGKYYVTPIECAE